MGDMIVLINPAFEAARFETLHRLAEAGNFPPGQNCTLAVFTSKGDWATKIAFPAGREVSASLFETHRDTEQRAANLTAVGHYAPYIAFDLVITKKDKILDEDDTKSAERVLHVTEQLRTNSIEAALTAEDRTYRFSHCQLQPRTNYLHQSPVFVVSVDPNIIPDHGSIDRGVFTRFLAEFLTSFSDADK
jgi:hypothetical protein